jgi:hypothetical protein
MLHAWIKSASMKIGGLTTDFHGKNLAGFFTAHVSANIFSDH